LHRASSHSAVFVLFLTLVSPAFRDDLVNPLGYVVVVRRPDVDVRGVVRVRESFSKTYAIRMGKLPGTGN
jgi:hypothetical protein